MDPVSSKKCTMCEVEKDLTEFHKQPTGKLGRHSYCAECFNAWKRLTRPTTSEGRGISSTTSKRWNLKSRYGMSPIAYEALLSSQGGLCAICKEIPNRPCVDHSHQTGRVRGILCHHCNIRLAALEDENYLKPAVAYLELHDPANDNNKETRYEARKR